METFIQPKITGYRQLSEEEAALMNEGKALAEQVGNYLAKLRFYIPTPSEGNKNNVPGAAVCDRSARTTGCAANGTNEERTER